MAAVVSPSLADLAVAVLSGGKTTDIAIAEAMAASRDQPETGRIAAFASAFLIKSGEPRADSRFMTKAIREASR